MATVHTPEEAPRGVLLAIRGDGTLVEDPFHRHSGKGWEWLHLSQKSEQVRYWLRRESGIPAAEARALIEEKTRPTCVQTEKGVLFIGRGVNLDPLSVPEDMVSIRAWLEHDRIITVVLRRLRSAEVIGESFEEGDRPESPADVLIMILSQMITRISPVVEELSEKLEDIQDSVIDDDIPIADIAELAPVRLRAATLHRYLRPLLEAAMLLANSPHLGESPKVKEELTLTHNRLHRIVEDLGALESRAAVTRDEMISRRSDQLNHRVYTLTVLAAVFLPLTVFTGLMGMNVGGIPLANTPIGFLITSLVMLLIMGLTLGLLRLIHWI